MSSLLVKLRDGAGDLHLGPGLSGVGTGHPNVCHYSGIVWTSRLGHIYHRPLLPILEPLPDPLVTDQSLIPLLVPVDTDWEHSQIWEQPPEPEPPPELDSHEDTPPF
ncbi:MAG: hypothetical protein ACRDRU_29450 [Pseudonocardiaceae bacterium]